MTRFEAEGQIVAGPPLDLAGDVPGFFAAEFGKIGRRCGSRQLGPGAQKVIRHERAALAVVRPVFARDQRVVPFPVPGFVGARDEEQQFVLDDWTTQESAQVVVRVFTHAGVQFALEIVGGCAGDEVHGPGEGGATELRCLGSSQDLDALEIFNR